MTDRTVDIKRIDCELPLPVAEPRAAGFDLPCRMDIQIAPRRIGIVPVNIVVRVPDNYFLLLALRSSTAIRKGLILANGVGVVDPFYCGDYDEIIVQLFNIGDEAVLVKRGEALVQGMFVPIEKFTWNEVASMNHRRDQNGYLIDDLDPRFVS